MVDRAGLKSVDAQAEGTAQGIQCSGGCYEIRTVSLT
jgi:hypothetical protein